jgi:NADH-quinone oxidoreductase subunit J
MPAFLIWIFAALSVIGALMVIANRNPVASALSLVLSFVGVAGLFLSLDAYFIAAIQILVYAGAVMVLFLFIIMLLDLKEEETKKWRVASGVGAFLVFLIFVIQLSATLWKFDEGKITLEDRPIQTEVALVSQNPAVKLAGVASDLTAGQLPDTRLVGAKLFGEYTFHLQITGFLLLVATIGVVLLSRKDTRN